MINFRELTDEEIVESTLWTYPEEGLHADWPAYLEAQRRPEWLHLGLLWNGRIVASVDLEDQGSGRALVHVASRRRAVHPSYLRYALVELAKFLFEFKVVSVIEASIPVDRRAARVLARSFPGMMLVSAGPEFDQYLLTYERLIESNVETETSGRSNSVSGEYL
jgi:hypothetical protein